MRFTLKKKPTLCSILKTYSSIAWVEQAKTKHLLGPGDLQGDISGLYIIKTRQKWHFLGSSVAGSHSPRNSLWAASFTVGSEEGGGRWAAVCRSERGSNVHYLVTGQGTESTAESWGEGKKNPQALSQSSEGWVNHWAKAKMEN